MKDFIFNEVIPLLLGLVILGYSFYLIASSFSESKLRRHQEYLNDNWVTRGMVGWKDTDGTKWLFRGLGFFMFLIGGAMFLTKMSSFFLFFGD